MRYCLYKYIFVGWLTLIFCPFPSYGIWQREEATGVAKLRKDYISFLKQGQWQEAWNTLPSNYEIKDKFPQDALINDQGIFLPLKSWVHQEKLALLKGDKEFLSKSAVLNGYKSDLKASIQRLRDFSGWVEDKEEALTEFRRRLQRQHPELGSPMILAEEKRWENEMSHFVSGYVDPDGKFQLPLPIEEEPFYELVGTSDELSEYYHSMADAIYTSEADCQLAIPYWEKALTYLRRMDEKKSQSLDKNFGWGYKGTYLKLVHCYDSKDLVQREKQLKAIQELKKRGVENVYISKQIPEFIETLTTLQAALQKYTYPTDIQNSCSDAPQAPLSPKKISEISDANLPSGYHKASAPFILGNKIFILGNRSGDFELFIFDRTGGTLLNRIWIASTRGEEILDPFYISYDQGKLVVFNPTVTAYIDPLQLKLLSVFENNKEILTPIDSRYDERDTSGDPFYYTSVLLETPQEDSSRKDTLINFLRNYPQRDQVITQLMSYLDPSQEQEARYTADEILGEIGDLETFKMIALSPYSSDYLVSPHNIITREANNPLGLERVLLLFKDSNSNIRKKMVESVGHLSSASLMLESQNKLLEQVLASLEDSSAEVREAAASLLAEKAAHEGIDSLVTILAYSQSPELKQKVLKELGDGKEEDAFLHIIPFINDPNPQIRQAAVYAASKKGGMKAWRHIKPILGELSVNDQSRISYLVVQAESQKGFEALIPLLKEDLPWITSYTLQTMAEIDSKKAKKYIKKALKNPDTHYEAIRPLITLEAKKGIDALVDFSKHSSPEIREMVPYTIGREFGNEDPDKVKVYVTGYLTDHDPQVRLNAAYVWIELETRDKNKDPRTFLNDPNPDLRAAALLTLELKNENIAIFEEALKDSSSQVQETAASLLLQEKHREGSNSFLELAGQLLHHENSNVKNLVKSYLLFFRQENPNNKDIKEKVNSLLKN